MMNLRPMEIRDNPAVAQLIRASLEEFGLDKPGTVYFDSHLDHLADYYQQQERAAALCPGRRRAAGWLWWLCTCV